MNSQLVPLPTLDLLENNSTKSVQISELATPLDIILIHHIGEHYAYVDQCPHFGVCLNWQPDQYFDRDHQYLQCSTHGALFKIDSGLCIYGPCHGDSLKPVQLIRTKNKYYVDIAQFQSPS